VLAGISPASTNGHPARSILIRRPFYCGLTSARRKGPEAPAASARGRTLAARIPSGDTVTANSA
jgi:hypothetical protein